MISKQEEGYYHQPSTVRASLDAFTIKCRFFVWNRRNQENLWQENCCCFPRISIKFSILWSIHEPLFIEGCQIVVLQNQTIAMTFNDELPIHLCVVDRLKRTHMMRIILIFYNPVLLLWSRVSDVNTTTFFKRVKLWPEEKAASSPAHKTSFTLPKQCSGQFCTCQCNVDCATSQGPRSLLFIVCHYSLWHACVRLYLNNAFSLQWINKKGEMKGFVNLLQ